MKTHLESCMRHALSSRAMIFPKVCQILFFFVCIMAFVFAAKHTRPKMVN